jgi:hypothetical protein
MAAKLEVKSGNAPQPAKKSVGGNSAPNAVTKAAMKEAEVLKRSHRARFATAKDLFDDLEKKRG